MSNEKSVPEQIAERNTSVDEDGDLRLGAGEGMGWFCCDSEFVESHGWKGEQLAAVRAWLVEQIRGAYKAGVESVAQTKADGAACLVETYGPDALAKAREEGRRQGWEEAASCFDVTAKHHTDNRDSKQREAHSLRAQAARLDEEARVQQETAKMARAVAAELRAAAPKEPA